MQGQRPRLRAGHPREGSGLPRGGFTLECDAVARIAQARLWGFWDLEVAGRFRVELLALCAQFGAKKWSALVDSRTFLPQTPEVTGHRRETMVMIMGHHCGRIAAIVAENGTYAMQFTRIATEAGVVNAVFLDPVRALEWVRED